MWATHSSEGWFDNRPLPLRCPLPRGISSYIQVGNAQNEEIIDIISKDEGDTQFRRMVQK